jgi:hypothetical protein
MESSTRSLPFIFPFVPVSTPLVPAFPAENSDQSVRLETLMERQKNVIHLTQIFTPDANGKVSSQWVQACSL